MDNDVTARSAPQDADLAFIAANVRAATYHRLTVPGLGGLEITLVDETRQIGGSFKYRGAVLGVSRHPDGVVACGSGNFPIAVGVAAARAGVRALLVMPEDAPARKREFAEQSAADILFVPRTEFAARASVEARERGWAMLHPFRDQTMLTGSSSLGREIAAQMAMNGSASDAVVVACGGGGLAAGIVMGLKAEGASNTCVVVEPEHYPRLSAAFAAGAPVAINPSGATICDALRVTEIGALAFDVLSASDVMVATASDNLVAKAQQLMAEQCGIQAEPSGALALAAALEGRLSDRRKRAWVVICGGNA